MKFALASLKPLMLLLGFFAASVVGYGQDVHYNYDRGTNFANYKTYEWVDIPRDAVPDQLVDQSIKRAVDEQLAQKGLSKVEKGGDLKVSYHAIISLEKSIDFSRMGEATGSGIGALGSEAGHAQTSTTADGLLVIDLVDSSHNQLIWRGDARKSLDLKRDPNKNYQALQKAMRKLFKNFPPERNK